MIGMLQIATIATTTNGVLLHSRELNIAWNNDAKYESGEWVARPMYANPSYRPSDTKGKGKSKDT
eukprot:4108677-Amphidinium_carterae.1